MLKDLSSDEHVTSFVVSDLYILMGREVESIDEVGAGNVLGKHPYIHLFLGQIFIR